MKAVAVLLGCALLGCPQVGSPLIEGAAQAPTFRTSSEGVRIDVLVTDRGKPVSGLTAKDFEVTDSGVRQLVDASTVADLPVDVILTLDTSTSLGQEGLAHLTRAADGLFARLRPPDRAALVTFSEDVNIRAALTPRHAFVRGMLPSLRVQGTTSVIDAAHAAMMLPSDPNRPTLLLLFSDGLDTASWLRPADVIDTMRRLPVVPYAVVVGQGSPMVVTLSSRSTGARAAAISRALADMDENERFLVDLVRTGAGLVIRAESTRDLARHFTDALDSFRRRYVLTYAPTGVERQGWHPLTVKVKGKSYEVRARPGYAVP